MNLQERNLSEGLQGEDVALLQRELGQLRFTIGPREVQANTFGATTKQAVLDFQRRHSLSATGIVETATAQRINAEVEALQSRPEPQFFLVTGVVRREDGPALQGTQVRATHVFERGAIRWDVGGEKMGQATLIAGEETSVSSHCVSEWERVEDCPWGRPLHLTPAEVVFHVLNRANQRRTLFEDAGTLPRGGCELESDSMSKRTSSLIDFTAMGNDMNRDKTFGCICRVEDTSITDTELIQSHKASSQGFRLSMVVMLREPLNLCCESVGYSTVELRTVFERLWRELNMHHQRRLYLLFTSSKGTRSVDFREDARRPSISWVNSRPVSGSVSHACSSSWMVFLIRAWSSSMVRSTTFMSSRVGSENGDFIVGKSIKGRKRSNHCLKSQEHGEEHAWGDHCALVSGGRSRVQLGKPAQGNCTMSDSLEHVSGLKDARNEWRTRP